VNADRWQSLEVRHLAALRAIAEEGTFARAAVRLGYTQSAVSQQIAALERIVGTRVLERLPGRRPVGLTAAGELLLRQADAMLARVQATQADLAVLLHGMSTLRVGTYQSIGVRILPEIMRRFGEECPNVDVNLHEAPGDAELLQLLEQAELDLTFAMLPTPDGPFDSLELLRDPYVLVVRADSPVASRAAPPTLQEIATLPLIGFRSCRNEQRIEVHMRARGAEPRNIFRSDDNGTVQGLVAAGVGAALVPRLTMDPTDPETVLLEIGDTIPPRLLGIVWHRDRHRSDAATAFTEIARGVCAETQTEPSAIGAAKAR
jgi:DNA-binding transcriptional LysR family regulator